MEQKYDEIDNELNFNNHISNICKKAGNKINAISRIQSFLGQKETGALVNTFVYSNLTVVHQVDIFQQRKAQTKLKKFKNVA